MKVLFLVKSEKTPSSRIRMLDMIPGLRKSGIDCTPEILPGNFFERWNLFKKSSDYDVVVLQKKLLNTIEFAKLRKHSRRLVFDFDDAIYLKNASPSTDFKDYRSYTRMRMFSRTVEKSDLLVAANGILAGKAMEIRKDVKVAIIPSPVKVEEILFKTDTEIRETPVIGWIGTKINLIFLEYISPALRELRKENDFILRIISDQEIQLEGIRTEFVKWSLAVQNCGLRDFDIGVMPLSADPFSEGKAAYKLIQYLAAGVPSVCSPVGMNMDFCKDDRYALSALRPEDFTRKILLLIRDRELRKSLSENGMRLVREKFDLKTIVESYGNALKKASA